MCKYEEALSEFRKDEITEDGYETIKEVLQDKINPWKPIESAPRDGTEILACCECASIKGFIDVHVIYGHTYGLGDMKFEWCQYGGDTKLKPTHWMPLPPSKEK